MYVFLFCVIIFNKGVFSDMQNNKTENTYDRFHFDEDRWIWGSDDGVDNRNVPGNETEGKLLATSPEPDFGEDPCLPYEPTKPDFRSPGTRISEAKCQEYKWEIEVRSTKALRDYHCQVKEASKKPIALLNIPIISGGRDTLPGEFLHMKNLGPPRPVIAGGRKTFNGEFLHMGAIGWKGVTKEWEFKCGGSLISTNYILTAAHCTTASSGDTTLQDTTPKIVRLNYKNIFFYMEPDRSIKYDVEIKRIIVHPEYKPPKKYFDIALMELDHDVEFNQFVFPSCLWSKSDVSELGTTATVSGWGALREGSLDISPELQAADINIIDTKKCDELLQSYCNRNWCGVEENQICAGKLEGGVDSCPGDSGGPLQVRIPLNISTSYNLYNIIGVTSFGIGCAQPNLPGVYTRVSSFIDWIESVVWP